MKKSTWYYILAVVALIVAVVVAVNANSTETNDNANTNDTMMEESVSITTVIQVDDEKDTYDQTVSASTTALQALQMLENDGTLTIETTEYDFGTIVDSIDTVGEDTTDNKFWIYYVNDEVADVGASTYQVMDGDTILWNYEAAQ